MLLFIAHRVIALITLFQTSHRPDGDVNFVIDIEVLVISDDPGI